ncbi:cyclophilin-like fold protein [Streptomyces sp. NBC_01768]|uniref:cyclophilin-like fold protein n=1 Tax=Streptomyces sp. NBC_01768 TaxID=2975938 RepID=UPI002DD98F0B|nr:cyclophilin-like fold protein [Streptomyces sp. NBC_01768]WSC33034.1 cyclophilin-like fold protein [Streptomyces sp. NBC_01768]
MNPAVRRRLVGAAPAAALLLAVTACSSDAQDNAPAATPSAAASAEQQDATASTPSPPSQRSTSMNQKVRVTLDGRPVDATLNTSPAARDFAKLFPLTLDLEDFHSTERIADLPRKLDTSGAPKPTAAKAGDIAYYAPWGNLALFYKDGSAPSTDLLVLGHLDVSADQLGRATHITIEAAS